MMTIKGQLLNTYVKREKFDGKEKVRNKVQLLVSVPQKDGSEKKELLDLTVPSEKMNAYTSQKGKEVEIPVWYVGRFNLYGI